MIESIEEKVMEFNSDKDLLSYLIKLQKDCEFSLRTMLQREDSSWKNCFSMLKLIKKGSRENVKFDYGKYVFEEQILDTSKGSDIISNIYSKDVTGKSSLIIPNYDSFKIDSVPQVIFIASKSEYSGLESIEYPLRFFNFGVQNDSKGNITFQNLLKKGLPFYPNIGEAILDLFELGWQNFGSFGEVYVVIPDYRARIELLKIVFSRAEIKIDSPEIGHEDLLLKVFAKSGGRRLTLPDIKISNDTTEIDVRFHPDALSAVLFSYSDNLKIDEKEFTQWRSEKEGILVERPDEEIVSLTKAGESQTLEYKYDVENENAKNEFIESVTSFLNTNNGVILIGVDDKGDIVGTKKSVDDIHKMIHDSCDPPPTNVKVGKKEIEGKAILIVEVPVGDSRPYQSKRTKHWYIRHNSNDMVMERSELLGMFEKKAALYSTL